MATRDVTVRKRSLFDEEDPRLEHASLTPAERIALAWQITRHTWAFLDETSPEPRLPGDPVRVLRKRR